ncbi:hypothetical protein M1078_18315 [Clostridioides difficile]|uniref:hypothetical protein n=1 Tax=Clostridioides difficile TaxID=1496 RepID=UPI000BB18507|nr:hypothetical protein [Clostridioides difficile]EGT4968474.1 hypothetical protein [Clostridioides difficile]MBY2495212.1 hypothetical protein [Clostridioides difficile]MBZ1201349.1 hypothetical protein [Clostridioides difficile]MCE4682912.1 hypothetical protein [Clostridioides difficile]MCE4756959.1 hypothetical protein [Clostridioides difficile]
MKEEKLELTEKELHCIARHLQNEVMEMVFRGNIEAPTSCEVCDYLQECKGDFTCMYHSFTKLSKITGVKVTAFKYCFPDENPKVTI